MILRGSRVGVATLLRRRFAAVRSGSYDRWCNLGEHPTILRLEVPLLLLRWREGDSWDRCKFLRH
jgi:hypothetical protein